MPDEIIVGAGKALIDVGPGGAFSVILMCGIAVLWLQWRKDMREAQERGDAAIAKLNERLREEQDAHQHTRDIYTTELKNSTRLAVSMDEMSRQLESLSRQVLEIGYRKERS